MYPTTIPYADQEWDSNLNTAVAVCPDCKLRVPLRVLKDFESFTGQEFNRHYTNSHMEPGCVLGIHVLDPKTRRCQFCDIALTIS